MLLITFTDLIPAFVVTLSIGFSQLSFNSQSCLQARSGSYRCTSFGHSLATSWPCGNYVESLRHLCIVVRHTPERVTRIDLWFVAFAESVVKDYLNYYAEEESSWSEVWMGPRSLVLVC